MLLEYPSEVNGHCWSDCFVDYKHRKDRKSQNKFVQILQLDQETSLFSLPAMENVQQQGYIKTNHIGISLSLTFPCWLFFLFFLIWPLARFLNCGQQQPHCCAPPIAEQKVLTSPHCLAAVPISWWSGFTLEIQGYYLLSGPSCLEKNHMKEKGQTLIPLIPHLPTHLPSFSLLLA